MDTAKEMFATFMIGAVIILSTQLLMGCEKRHKFMDQCSDLGHTVEECIQLWSLGREVR